jgi:putative sigma-54 modulation protein
MKIEYTGRQTEVPAEVRRLVERKLAKLSKVLPGITTVHVVVAIDRHRQVAEMTVHSARLDLTARSASSDVRTSILDVVEKLGRQAEHARGKWQHRTKGDSARAASPRRPPTKEAAPDLLPRIIRSARRVGKPMSLDEAALEVRHGDQGVLVFRDSATERVRVMFRRRDGHLGLIEAED